MEIINHSTNEYSKKINSFYEFDSLNSSDKILQLFNMLKNQSYNIVDFSVSLEHDHTSEGKPIDCYSYEELALFLSHVDFDRVEEISFNGTLNEMDIYGGAYPKTAMLQITTSKKNDLDGPVR